MKKILPFVIPITACYPATSHASGILFTDKNISNWMFNNFIQIFQVESNDAIYYYNWTGFDEKLPEYYVKVGTIVGVSNVNIPEDNFCGAQVELGQEIYALDDNQDCIYIKYTKGFARFVMNHE